MTRIYRPLYTCFYSLRSKRLISVRFGEKIEERESKFVGKMAWVKGREGEGEGGEEWLSFPVLRGQNRNPVPRSFFDPKPYGDACYASCCFYRARLYLSQSWSILKINKNRKKTDLANIWPHAWSITYHKLASFFPFLGVFIEPDLLLLSCQKRKKKRKEKKRMKERKSILKRLYTPKN